MRRVASSRGATVITVTTGVMVDIEVMNGMSVMDADDAKSRRSV